MITIQNGATGSARSLLLRVRVDYHDGVFHRFSVGTQISHLHRSFGYFDWVF